jgi:iron(III) transport system permease protein
LHVVTVLAVLAMLYLLVVPLVVQIITAVRGPFLPFGVPSARWGLSNFATLYGATGDVAATFVDTAEYVLGATAISMLLGWMLAWLVVRTTLPLRRVITVLVVAPFVIPPIVQSEAFLLMLAPRSGIMNQLLRLLPWWSGATGPINPYSFGTLIVVQGFASVTFPFMFLMPVLMNMDGTLEEAGRTSGASSWQVFRRVTVPALWPATLGIGILQVILLMGSLEIPLLFGQESGGNILSLKMYDLLTNTNNQFPQYGLAAAYGLNFLVVTGLIFQLYRYTIRHAARRATLTGKGIRAVRYRLGRWRAPALVGIALFLVPTIVLPLLALIWSSLTPFPLRFSTANFDKHASLDAYRAVLKDPLFWSALQRTFFIAVLAATISVCIATIGAFVVARSRTSAATRLLDLLASSSIAIPSAIGGFAALLLYMVTNKHLHLNGTVWVLVLVYSYRIAVSYRTIYGAIFQVGGELEEAAASSGASRLQTLRRVVLPLILPTVAMGWVGSFLLNAQEFTLPVFLSTPQTEPVSVYMYSRLYPGSGADYAPSQGAAMALIFAVLVVVVGIGLRAAAGWWSRGGARRRRAAPAVADGQVAAPLAAATR